MKKGEFNLAVPCDTILSLFSNRGISSVTIFKGSIQKINKKIDETNKIERYDSLFADFFMIIPLEKVKMLIVKYQLPLWQSIKNIAVIKKNN